MQFHAYKYVDFMSSVYLSVSLCLLGCLSSVSAGSSSTCNTNFNWNSEISEWQSDHEMFSGAWSATAHPGCSAPRPPAQSALPRARRPRAPAPRSFVALASRVICAPLLRSHSRTASTNLRELHRSRSARCATTSVTTALLRCACVAAGASTRCADALRGPVALVRTTVTIPPDLLAV